MGDLLGRLQAKTEVWRSKLAPVRDCFCRRDAVKSVVYLGCRKALRIEGQHFRSGKIFRVKASFPFGILESRCANPVLHVPSPRSAVAKRSNSLATCSM